MAASHFTCSARSTGKLFLASGEISRLVAEYEPLFVATKRRNELIEATGLSQDEVVVPPLTAEKALRVGLEPTT